MTAMNLDQAFGKRDEVYLLRWAQNRADPSSIILGEVRVFKYFDEQFGY
jgi:hypothetical protein